MGFPSVEKPAKNPVVEKTGLQTPPSDPPTLEVLVKAHRLRYVTHLGASAIFCKLQKSALFKAFSAKQRAF